MIEIRDKTTTLLKEGAREFKLNGIGGLARGVAAAGILKIIAFMGETIERHNESKSGFDKNLLDPGKYTLTRHRKFQMLKNNSRIEL